MPTDGPVPSTAAINHAITSNEDPQVASRKGDLSTSKSIPSSPAESASAIASSSLQSRPRLEESSFSWMLDKEQNSAASTARSSSAARPDHAQLRSALFGGAADSSTAASKDTKRSDVQSRQRRTSREATAEPPAEEAFDMSSLRHSKGR
jgi:hypothetical protein